MEPQHSTVAGTELIFQPLPTLFRDAPSFLGTLGAAISPLLSRLPPGKGPVAVLNGGSRVDKVIQHFCHQTEAARNTRCPGGLQKKYLFANCVAAALAREKVRASVVLSSDHRAGHHRHKAGNPTDRSHSDRYGLLLLEAGLVAGTDAFRGSDSVKRTWLFSISSLLSAV